VITDVIGNSSTEKEIFNSRINYKFLNSITRLKMGDGFNGDEPGAPKYCEVIQIGIEDDTAEVTIFYTPERGQY